MAPTIAGNNCLTEAEDKLVTMIANSVEFISWTGEADANAAKDRVIVDELPPPANGETYSDTEVSNLYPQCMIGPPGSGEPLTLNHMTSDGRYGYGKDLAFTLQFTEIVVTSATLQPVNYQNLRRTFKNTIGTIAEQIEAQSGTGGLFDFSTFKAVGAPVIEPFDLIQDFGVMAWWDWEIERVVR